MAESSTRDSEKAELRQDAHRSAVADSSTNPDLTNSPNGSTQPSSRATPVSIFTVDDAEPDAQPPPYSAEAAPNPQVSTNNLSHSGYIYPRNINNNTSTSIDPQTNNQNDSPAIYPNTSHASSSNNTSPSLPVAIPQVAAGPTMPFTRAYAPSLSQRDIAEVDFINFLDGLNIAATHNAVFSSLDIAGRFIGNVPIPPVFDLVGYAISSSAKFCTSESNRQRTAAYLAASNETLFGPKGLKVTICSAADLRPRVGFPENARMVLPLQSYASLDYQPTVPQRRMLALQNYVAEIRETTMRRPRKEGAIVKKQNKIVDQDVRRTENRMERGRKRAEKSGEYDLKVSKEEKEAEKLLYVLVEAAS